jgi:lysophospholipase L1-like esterase
MKYRYILFLLILGLLFSCKPELDDFSPSQGNADFSTYVALGNSLTSGYADGSLYRSAQMNSFPSILAQQFQKAGGGNFVQPLMTGEYGIFPGKLKVGYKTDCLGNTSLSPVPDMGQLDALSPLGYPVNNLGVPGAKSFHLLAPKYGDFAGIGTYANPYFARFATSANSSVIMDAMALQPTFFTLWIGNNDVLGYATSGGMGDSITGQGFYAYVMNVILTNLTLTGAKGAIANIPDVTSVPFFNTIPANGYVVTQEEADILNQYLGPFGLHYQAGPNYFIIADPSIPVLGFRQMVEGELLLLTLPQDSLKCAYWGGFNPVLQIPKPIPGQYVLTISELDQIKNAVDGYNATLSALANQFDLAYIDMNSKMNELKNGIVTDGIRLSADFITGNSFSLDGIHLSQMGNAYVANQFILGINGKYGSNLPTVSMTNYQAVLLP